MNATLKGCLLLAIVAFPAFAQTAPGQQAPRPMNCPMMADADQMQKQMGAMMADMRAMMNASGDPTAKARMQTMHDHMSAMMANMQKMHGGTAMGTSSAETAKAESKTPSATGSAKENHEEHHP